MAYTEVTRHDSDTIVDLDQLESQIKNYSQTLITLSTETDHKKVLVNSLKAQLEVISVAKNPTLCKSAFDLMLQSLNDAAEEIDNEKELRNIQKRAALMTNNMIFFFDSYLYFRQDKQSKEGQAVLNKACDTIATTVNDIFDNIKNDPSIILQKEKFILVSGKLLFENILKEGKGFFKAIRNLLFGKKELEKLKESYYDFLISAIEKLDRYKRLFGRSVVLAEMIRNKSDDIVQYSFPFPEEPKDEELLEEDHFIPALIILGITAVLFIALGVVKLLNYENVANWLWTAVKYSGIVTVVAFIIPFIIYGFKKISYMFSVKRCLKNRAYLEAELDRIARLFYD